MRAPWLITSGAATSAGNSLSGAGSVKMADGNCWPRADAAPKNRKPQKNRCDLHFGMALFWSNRRVLVYCPHAELFAHHRVSRFEPAAGELRVPELSGGAGGISHLSAP